MKIFLDANILFSASDARSATHRLLSLLQEKHEIVTSPHAWEEARRNLEAKRAHLLPGLDQLKSFVSITRAFAPTDTMPAEIAEKDQPILAGAIGAKCTHLWTSDSRHFGHLYGTKIHGVLICSSIQMAEERLKASS